MNSPLLLNRRQWLHKTACGFGSLALYSLLAEEARAAAADPLAPRAPHLKQRAKSVIFLFMEGGPSQVDTFDPKPELMKFHNQKAPKDGKDLRGEGRANDVLFGSPFKFNRCGKSGTEVSEIFPHLGGCMDDICVVRSMYCDRADHGSAITQYWTGEPQSARPSFGSWVTYGLGSENRSLPGYITLATGSRRGTELRPNHYGSAFLPASYQGTLVTNPNEPIRHLAAPSPGFDQRLGLINRLNSKHAAARPDDARLEARIASFELASRMQLAAPEAFDLSKENEATRRSYGLEDAMTREYGQQLLLARRLVERGVRFVTAWSPAIAGIDDGDPPRWDHHGKLPEQLPMIAKMTDQPIAALLRDLKERGLLDSTLVVWGGEFGRTVTFQGKDGRDHHRHGFSVWLAGGGVKGGHVHGATDELGHSAVENRVHLHDLHATILHQLGLDHERLTFRHGGRDYRLTDVHGNVVKGILA